MYFGWGGDKLNGLRFTSYISTLVSSRQSTRSETSPPTESAAHFHCRRVYLQVQTWEHLSSNTTSEEEWGMEAGERASRTCHDSSRNSPT